MKIAEIESETIKNLKIFLEEASIKEEMSVNRVYDKARRLIYKANKTGKKFETFFHIDRYTSNRCMYIIRVK